MASLGLTRPVIYPNEINRILRMPGGPIGKSVRKLSLDIAAEGERLARAELGNKSPHDKQRSGRYARSFRVTVKTNTVQGFEFEVANTAAYAGVLEEGSRPHQIKARRAKYLRFKDRQGIWRRVKAVSHPGQRNGYHILWRATEKAVKANRIV